MYSIAAIRTLVIALCLAGSPVLRAQLADAQPVALAGYGELPGWTQQLISAEEYRRLAGDARFELQRFSYVSDGLKVFGFVHRLRDTGGRKLPVLVYCRGGVGEGAKISSASALPHHEMRAFAAAGYLVVAPQYRGIDGGEGKDEVGGADVADVLNLLPYIRSLPEADASRLFLCGSSRGGMMALQAARAGFPARAVAVTGAPTDWEEAMQANARLQQLAADYWPGYAESAAPAIERRSAARWAAEIPVPVAIFHGAADATITPENALALARGLARAKRTYELVIYAGDNHPVWFNHEDRLRRTLAWFAKHEPAPAVVAVPEPVAIVARDYALEFPTELPAGHVGFRFSNQGTEPHYVRFARLAAGKTMADFAAWREAHGPAPAWLQPAGGVGTVAPGITCEYVVKLTPGRYVAYCGHPSPDGVQHVDKGMFKEFIVMDRAAGGALPTGALALVVRDNAFEGTLPAKAGRHEFKVSNPGESSHQVLLVQLPEGVTAEQELAWFRGGSRGQRPGRPVGGIIELPAKEEAAFAATLTPGRYLLLCGMRDSTGGRHFDAGASRAFTIE